jgi:hypothetical protein
MKPLPRVALVAGGYAAAVLAAALSTLVLSVVAGAQPAPRPLKLVEEMRIDGANEDLAHDGASSSVVFSRGSLAFFDAVNVRFVFFDSAGKRLGNFGRKGAGPGEFQPNGTIRMASGASRDSYTLTAGRIADTLWIYDQRQRRFTVVSPQGRLLRTLLDPTLELRDSAGAATDHALLGFRPVALYSNGETLGEATFGGIVQYTQPDGDKGKWWKRADSAYVVMTGRGSVARAVAQLPRNDAQATIDRPGAYRTAGVPFAAPPLRDVSAAGDRVVIVTTSVTTPTGGSYVVTTIGSRGDTILRRSYPFTSPPVSPRAADSAYRVLEKQLGANSAELLQQARQRMPKVAAPLRRVLAGADGSVWLGLTSADAQPWLLLTARGEPVGTVTLARGHTLLEATQETVWVVERDDDGFARIIRYRVDAR